MITAAPGWTPQLLTVQFREKFHDSSLRCDAEESRMQDRTPIRCQRFCLETQRMHVNTETLNRSLVLELWFSRFLVL